MNIQLFEKLKTLSKKTSTTSGLGNKLAILAFSVLLLQGCVTKKKYYEDIQTEEKALVKAQKQNKKLKAENKDLSKELENLKENYTIENIKIVESMKDGWTEYDLVTSDRTFKVLSKYDTDEGAHTDISYIETTILHKNKEHTLKMELNEGKITREFVTDTDDLEIKIRLDELTEIRNIVQSIYTRNIVDDVLVQLADTESETIYLDDPNVTIEEIKMTHQVQKGETLSSIANKYPGISYKDIMKANRMENHDIYPEQSLKIPTQIVDTQDTKQTKKSAAENQSTTNRSGKHKVQPGETFYSLKKKYNTTVEELKKANNIETLKHGTTIKVPGPAKQENKKKINQKKKAAPKTQSEELNSGYTRVKHKDGYIYTGNSNSYYVVEIIAESELDKDLNSIGVFEGTHAILNNSNHNVTTNSFGILGDGHIKSFGLVDVDQELAKAIK